MIIFDYFVYIIYTFTKNKLGIESDDALRGSVGLLAVYTTMFIIGFLTLIGIIVDNPVSQIAIEVKPVPVVIFGITAFFLFRIRYYKRIKDLDNKIKDYDQHDSNKNIRRIIYFILIAVPILFFVPYWIFIKEW